MSKHISKSSHLLSHTTQTVKRTLGEWSVTPEKQQQQNCSNSYTKKDVQTPQLLNQPLKPEEEKN